MNSEVAKTDEEVFAFPASFAQQRLWFLDQVDPLMAVYNVPLGLRVGGPLDLRAVEASLREIVGRHESLRTTFVGQEGTPLQLVAPKLDFSLQVVDLRVREDIPRGEREAEALRLAAAEAQAPFHLQRGPLFRALAIVVDDATHFLVFNAHHIICDGGSLTILLQELSALYPAFAAGKPSPLPEVTTQYADFALWQRECFEGAALEPELSFWKTQLGQARDLPVLTLPSDRNRPASQTFEGGSVRFLVSSSLTNKLGALARQEGASLFMLTLTAFDVFLSRLSGQNEVLVGTPIANRERSEIAASVGFYTNTVVFRTDLSPRDGRARTFKELLHDVRKTTMDVLAHQDVPFERVVEAIRPQRSTSHNPVFQAMFGLQRAPEAALSLPGMKIAPIDVHCGMSKFDVTLDMQEIEGGMQGLLEYSSDLFDRDTAEAFARHFSTLLESIAENPDAPIDALDLLGAAERKRILSAPNTTERAFATDLRLHDLVAAQAARAPEAIAVEHEGQSLSYGELDRRSTELAAYLGQLGVTPDALVAICMDRSLDLIVALVGVLKAGGAYLPLDPAYPVDRLAYMLEDSKSGIVLTQSHLRDDLPDVGGRVVVAVDTEQAKIAKAPQGVAPVDVSPEHRAYVIYTSGSTGKPKGVEIPHRAVVNFLQSMAVTPGLGPSDRLLAVTTLSFDISVLELFLPLTVGATILLASRDTATDGQALLELLVGSRATVLQATPATYRMLIEAGWERSETPLRLLCGGEAMPPALASSLLERASELWNMYGPTETTVWSTCKRIDDPDAIAIGRPIANTQVYVLDAALEPVPSGVLGQLFIGGRGVARGYLDRPELTSERFVDDPFGGPSGPGKMYATGDLARLARDGELHFVGRGDTQVKVRGFRIELGEIEAVLGKHEDLLEVAVVVRTDATGDPRIVAYVVHRPDVAPTPSELRRHLKQSLPDHMIPHFFVELPQLPKTQNGKIDRKTLPDPFESTRRAVDEDALPTTETEKIVAEIWRDLLKVKSVGLHDNFFDLGGHSLLSMQAIHRIATRTGHRLNPRSMVFDTLLQISAECARTEGP